MTLLCSTDKDIGRDGRSDNGIDLGVARPKIAKEHRGAVDVVREGVAVDINRDAARQRESDDQRRRAQIIRRSPRPQNPALAGGPAVRRAQDRS